MVPNSLVVVLEGTAYEVREGDAPALELPDQGEEGTEPPGPEDPGDANSPGNIFEVILQAIVEFVEGLLESFRQ